MDAKLVQGKHVPVMVELGGKLYALSYDTVSDPPSFEVFDPTIGTWSALPEPPFFQQYGQYHRGGTLSYAVTGTKMFVSQSRCPVFCFDVAHPRREWRLVHSMCQRGPFPFVSGALVLDLPGDNNNNKKLTFAYGGTRCWNLGAYIMFLDKNRESLTQIADLKLPRLPEEFEFAKRCFLLHIGGQKACLVAPSMCPPEEQLPKFNQVGSHKTRGVAIPFRFEVDITKIDKDAKNCLTLQFMPTRIFEFCTNPSTFPSPRAHGCFVL
uniref:uncharacterized protein LOC105349982 n=1 Tax=Fragaria vesca subsp. vesca TaxID=101020 RepID=UPI0005C9195C|nr:PREDICTED: uncharacterized protein LOC105349982 [Fragaria vesca subsp. vesca]